jgi:hypothetical protein
MVRNQNDEKVATGEAMVEFPADAAAGTVFTSNLSHADRKRAARQRAADQFAVANRYNSIAGIFGLQSRQQPLAGP